MPVLITDIDSTLNDHWLRIRRNTVPRWPGGHISSAAWTWPELSKDLILPGAHEVLWHLANRGFKISYLTARNWDHDGALSRRQLAEFELPNPNDVHIVRVLNDKLDFLACTHCDYYVDDFMTGQESLIGTFHRDVAMRIAATGVRVIVFRNMWFDVLEQINACKGLPR